jgi:flagellin
MISLQTNVDSLVAQQNLNLANEFESNAIQQLTSGYRINKSGDDAAGLAIANGLESEMSQLTQGVSNGNNGLSQLQIVDGGLSNISTLLNRMQTLATESAADTFAGNRATLNKEYSGLINEISRQASNINLASGGAFNQSVSVYLGGGNSVANSTVSVDLSGAQNAVDALSLGLADTSVQIGGTGFAGNTVSLTGWNFLAGASETFQLNAVVNGTNISTSITVTGGSGGISGSDVLTQLNQALDSAGLGIVASQNNAGQLIFSGSHAFNVQDLSPSPELISAAATPAADNATQYVLTGNVANLPVFDPATETLTFQIQDQTINVTLSGADETTGVSTANAINAVTAQYGVYAVVNAAGTGVDFQSTNPFQAFDSVSSTGLLGYPVNDVTPPPAGATPTANADAAITAINNAIQQLGLTQGVVGAGENALSYAINLAQTQITNLSASESQIRDADIAAQAADLSKSQVLTQTAVAALAQANAEPQAVAKLLQR